jgi:PAS domain S-box-containing protein
MAATAGRRVLLVNDLQVVTEILAEQLRSLGVGSLVLARDGSRALDTLEHEPVDVVVSDVHMPILDGFQLCRLMRSTEFPDLNRVPVVLVSATYRDQAAQRLARDVGAQAFLEWPFSAEDLGGAIEQALRSPETVLGEPVRVLIADDESAIRSSLAMVLEREGFEVRGVADGQAAIDAGDAWRPHLVLCDYMMPKQDGAAVLAWYQQHRPDTPIIILTAHGTERLAVDMMRKGAYDYLAKPFEIRGIPDLCRGALEKHNVKRISRQFDDMLVALRRAEGRYRALFENASDAIFVSDADGRIEEVNRRGAEMLGREPREVVGQLLVELLRPAGADLPRDVLASLRLRGEASAEALLRSAGGDLSVEVAGAPVVVEGEERWITVARDLSDRKWIGAFVRHEHQFLEHLYLDAQRVGSESDLSALLRRSLASALRLLGMDAGAILSIPWGDAAAAGFTLAAEQDISWGVAQEVARRLHSEPADAAEPHDILVAGDDLLPDEREGGLASRLELGLVFHGKLLGYLLLWRKGDGTLRERDRMLARSIASYLALALENASLLSRLLRAQEEWQRTFDGVADMICVVDHEGRVMRANRALMRRVERVGTALVGLDARELLWGDVLPETTPLDEARQSGETRSAETELPGLGSGDFVVSASPLYAEDRSYRGSAVVVRDVTSERRAQQQLLLSEKMATLGRLVAGVTHELNNPAAFVLLNLTRLQEVLGGFAEVLESYRAAVERAAPEEAKRLRDLEAASGTLELLRDASALTSESLEGMRRIREITRELRFFSHAREEPDQLFDLNAVVESAIAMTRYELRHKARLKMQLEKLPPCMGDPARMGQVIVNLIVNAAQAIDDGRVAENEIRVWTYHAEGMVCVEVTDTGRGISPANLPRIFDPFFTTKAPGSGTGLGLALCYEIVKRHHGEVAVSSEPGRGTTFRVSLPPAKGHRLPVPEPGMPVDDRPARVLVIDDEVPLQKALRRVLRQHELRFATTGREAMVVLEGDRAWDLVLCDVVMPDVSGVEVFERIQREWPDLEGRLAFMTGGVRSEALLADLRKAGRPILEKPVETATLRRLIAELRRPGSH